jgi:hypothetical protein
MAFYQPAYPAPQRIDKALDESRPSIEPEHSRPQESQEWILFSPRAASARDRVFTTSSSRTRLTAGRSHVSDRGSFGTATQSYCFYEDGSTDDVEGQVEDEDDGELDSLDSHLHEFGADLSAYRESPPGPNFSVLPKHDGLGSFRFNQSAMGELQEHLYAFEQYNPKRVKRQRDSLEFGQDELGRMLEKERLTRIEAWRRDQSLALLDEIREETIRRKQSIPGERRSVLSTTEEELATLGSENYGASESENDGFWTHITRKVIEDLLGIDDRLLSILFGEAIAENDVDSSTLTGGRPTHDTVVTSRVDNSWEDRLLERIARELGFLVHQISDHPGAFSAYLGMQQIPLPYAGLPIIPEVVQDASVESNQRDMALIPEFQPTLQMQTGLLGISETEIESHFTEADDFDARSRVGFPTYQAMDTGCGIQLSKEEWERDIDIKMVFRYLKSRFTSRLPSPPPLSRNVNLATSSPQDAAARADRVRQNHPLVSRQERRPFKTVTPSSPMRYRRGSSCASPSTRMSPRRNSGSSRHYWDVSGSIGSGSLIASAGAWGEV